MADATVTNADIDSLAAKLETMSDQFSDQEHATLLALFGLAGMGIESVSDEVEGFVGVDSSPFQVTVPGADDGLTGLRKSFAGKLGGFSKGVAKIGLGVAGQ